MSFHDYIYLHVCAFLTLAVCTNSIFIAMYELNLHAVSTAEIGKDERIGIAEDNVILSTCGSSACAARVVVA